jgi:uracil-DNA glycosylase family protein
MISAVSKDQSKDSAADFFPTRKSIKAFRDAAADCKACDLWQRGTQTVFGEGARRAEVFLVGEQPGNEEDLTGHPFVGPAGRLLNDALAEAGIDRARTYVTNVVKHFKWEPRGKRRIHKKPNAGEIAACRPWLEAELGLVKPKVIVCLGATAAQTLLGPKFRVSKQRGQFIESTLAPYIMATVHPSSILRAPDDATRHAEKRRFIDDLKKVARVISKN